VKNRLLDLNSTCPADESPRQRLVEVLEGYLEGLEKGTAPDQAALLSAHPELADELRPYLDSLRLLHGATRDLRPPGAMNGSAPPEASSPSAPGVKQIGDYRIVREIGRGGMGIVYEAHQKSLNRRVALKMLPFAAVLDQRQIARFRNEAQAAAQLHHPHIVPVFAVGQEQGVYYYAMQYIDGQSLEQAIAELREAPDGVAQRSTKAAGAVNGSTTTLHHEQAAGRTSQRSIRDGNFFRTVARLGKEAAEALQHAHEFGIVHRDVKPSNLLIDEQGKLWVTDFGLARMQTDHGVTLTGDVVGTLRYMSPEQAAGRPAPVDGRTDVYSLGATLYELLTQKHAHPGEDRETLLRQIIGDDPLPPRRHNPAVPVDLETIVLTAMAKSRDERYVSAQAMADDMERFLAGKPTLARRPTLVDRAAKWARRHRSMVALGMGAAILLSIISAVGTAMLAREQAHTSAALVKAEQYFRQARGAVDHFGMQLADRLVEIPGTEPVRRDLLNSALAYYRQFVDEAADDPHLRRDLAVAHFKSGVIASKLGASEDAIEQYNRALAILDELAATDSPPAEQLAQLAVTQNNLALLFASRGEVAAARDHYANAIAIQQRLVRRHAGEPSYAGHLAESQANFGMLLDQIGETKKAERSLRASVDILRPLAESDRGNSKHARDLAIACNNLSYVLRKRDSDAAFQIAKEAIAILERLAQSYPGEDAFQDDLALCYNNLAALETGRDRLVEASRWHGEAIALQEQLARKAPAVVRHRSDLAVSLNNLGVLYCRLENPKNADEAFARAQQLFTTLAGDYPDELAYRSSFAALLNNQALALSKAGRPEEALRIYPAAIESQRAAWAQAPSSPIMCDVLSKMYYNYGQSLRDAGRLADAAQIALARRDVWKGNAQRLFGVAVELAQLDADSRKSTGVPEEDGAELHLDDEVVTTLWQVHDSGWPSDIDLAADERFAHLQENEHFAALLAQLSQEPAEADSAQGGRSTKSSRRTN
jgi:serine/threonine protein kinase/tetratricopeptide (TPR) repeat protein